MHTNAIHYLNLFLLIYYFNFIISSSYQVRIFYFLFHCFNVQTYIVL